MAETGMLRRPVKPAEGLAENMRAVSPLAGHQLNEFVQKYGKTPFGIAAGHLRTMGKWLGVSEYYRLEKIGYPLLKKPLRPLDFRAASENANNAHYQARNAMEIIEKKVAEAQKEKNPRSSTARDIFHALMGEKPEQAQMDILESNLRSLRKTDEMLWKKKRLIDRFARAWEAKLKREEATKQAGERKGAGGVLRTAPAGAR
jgi:hypothetical protein